MHTAHVCVLSHFRWIEFQRHDSLVMAAAPYTGAIPHQTHLHVMKIVGARTRSRLGITLPAHNQFDVLSRLQLLPLTPKNRR